MPKSTHAKDTVSFRKEAERTAIEERTIQRRIDRSDEKVAGKNNKKDQGAHVRRSPLQRLGKTSRQGGADYRRRLRHRPCCRRPVRARRSGRGSGLSRRT